MMCGRAIRKGAEGGCEERCGATAGCHAPGSRPRVAAEGLAELGLQVAVMAADGRGGGIGRCVAPAGWWALAITCWGGPLL